jgi:hypothetical protein
MREGARRLARPLAAKERCCHRTGEHQHVAQAITVEVVNAERGVRRGDRHAPSRYAGRDGTTPAGIDGRRARRVEEDVALRAALEVGDDRVERPADRGRVDADERPIGAAVVDEVPPTGPSGKANYVGRKYAPA